MLVSSVDIAVSSDEYFRFMVLTTLAATNSLCLVIRSTKQHRFEFFELFSDQ